MTYTIEYYNNGERVALRGPFTDKDTAMAGFNDFPRLTPGDTAQLCLDGKAIAQLAKPQPQPKSL